MVCSLIFWAILDSKCLKDLPTYALFDTNHWNRRLSDQSRFNDKARTRSTRAAWSSASLGSAVNPPQTSPFVRITLGLCLLAFFCRSVRSCVRS